MKNVKLFALICFGLAVLSPLFAFQWPLEGAGLIKSFGEASDGDFFTGVLIRGEDISVAPIEDGEMVYYYEEDPRRNSLPSGIGNYLLMEHDRGIRSLYGNLDVINASSGRIGKERTIGTVEDALYLQVLDYEFHRYVNPLMSLPLAEDSLLPRLNAVYLSRGDEMILLESGMRISAGHWDVYVASYDPAPGGRRRAPHRFASYLNGEVQKQLTFETIEASDSALRLSREGDLSAGELYQKEGLYHLSSVNLSRGAFTLELAVSDYAGNETSRSYLLKVR